MLNYVEFIVNKIKNDCNIINGINDKDIKESNSGKLVNLPYPQKLENWPQKCLSKFLEEQSFSFNFDFKI